MTEFGDSVVVAKGVGDGSEVGIGGSLVGVEVNVGFSIAVEVARNGITVTTSFCPNKLDIKGGEKIKSKQTPNTNIINNNKIDRTPYNFSKVLASILSPCYKGIRSAIIE
jgi:hypothetical protein